MAILYREDHEEFGTQGFTTLCDECKEQYETENPDYYLDVWETNNEPCDKCGKE